MLCGHCKTQLLVFPIFEAILQINLEFKVISHDTQYIKISQKQSPVTKLVFSLVCWRTILALI